METNYIVLGVHWKVWSQGIFLCTLHDDEAKYNNATPGWMLGAKIGEITLSPIRFAFVRSP